MSAILSALSFAVVLVIASRHPHTAGLLVPLAIACVCAFVVSALQRNGGR